SPVRPPGLEDRGGAHYASAPRSGAPSCPGGRDRPSPGVRHHAVVSTPAEHAGTTVDGADVAAEEGRAKGVDALCDELAGVADSGWYAAIEVTRPWSRHNPRLTGEFARTSAVRRYLHRELTALVRAGAQVTVRPSRAALPFDDPGFFAA